MKILHVNIARYGGGLEQYLMQLFDELEKRGHNNIFIYGENSKSKPMGTSMQQESQIRLSFVPMVASIQE